MKKHNLKNFIITHLFFNISVINGNTKGAHLFDYFLLNLKNEILEIFNNNEFKIKSIYLAGKSLSTLNNNQLENLLKIITDFIKHKNFEFTYQCNNVNYITLERLTILKKFNVNRIVWKIKKFQNQYLKKIKQSCELGFTNFSIDLVLSENKKEIINNIKASILLNAKHISISYIQKNDAINQFLIETLKKSGFHQYEFFSFAKEKKYYSQQTIGYLTLENWCGFGSNASSFLKNKKNCFLTKNNNFNFLKQVKILNEQEYSLLTLLQGLTLKQGILLNKKNQIICTIFKENLNKLIKNNFFWMKLFIIWNKFLKNKKEIKSF